MKKDGFRENKEEFQMIKYVVFISFLLITLSYGQSKLINHSPQQITLEFELPQVKTHLVTIENRDYIHINYDDAQSLVHSGAPIVPYTITRVAIPPEAAITMQYQILSQNELFQSDVVPTTIVNGMKENNRVEINQVIYNTATPYPGEIVEINEPYIFREMRMVDVKIYPVQYHPAEHRVRLLNKLTIQLRLKGGKPGLGVARFSDTGKALLKNRLINFEEAKNWAVPKRSTFSKQTSINYDFSVGNWYKIPISEEGIYQISGQFLRDAGLSISSIDVATIQMFNKGGIPLSTNVSAPRPEDLNEIAIEVDDKNNNGTLDPDDVIYFFGRSVSGWNYNSNASRWDFYLNPYSFSNYYLFTFNQGIGKRIQSQQSPSGSAQTPTHFTDLYRLEEENYNILESGLDWYWIKFQGASGESTINFSLPQNILADSQRFSFRLKGGSGSHYWEPNNFNYNFSVFINNQSVGNLASFGNSSQLVRNNLSITSLQSGNNELKIQYTGNQEGCYAYFDYLELNFKRRFVAENNFLKFYYTVSSAPKEFFITGLPSGTHRVWDISDYANIKAITPLANGSTVRFQAVEAQPQGKQYYVFAAQAIKPVTEISEIENTPNLRNIDRKGKLLLITADEFYEAAEQWETYKETFFLNPLQTERVKVGEIFREFSSCIPDPTAIRDFIRYAYLNWSEPPEFVQLVGDGSYDYRNIALPNYVNRVPVFEVTADNDITSRSTDNFFTAINNNSGGFSNLDPELAIARMPANSVNDVENYLRKMQAYGESYKIFPGENGWQTILTFVADDECRSASSCNEWFHLDQTEGIVNVVPRKFDLKKIYLVDYDTQAGGLGRQKPKAAADLLDQVNQGTLMINFFGHGDPNTWAHEQVLNKARDLPLINNGAKLPVWIAATCTWGKYDDPNTPSMAEEMVWADDGGGIASIAASRASFAFQNEVFAKNIYKNLFYNGSDNRRSRPLGEAVQMSVGGGTNDQKYHIFGDVALQLADPRHVIKVTSISADTLKALSTVTVTASVYDSEDNFLSDFNGKALVRVYDAVDSLTHSSINFYYTYPGGTIFKGIVSVENGELQGSFIVPKSIKYKNSRTGRVSIYAWSENMQDAVGYNQNLLFTGTESLTDTRGPDIKFSFPDQPDFFDGDFVGSQPTIIVRLTDENGLNLTGETGHRIELIIDNNLRKDVTEFFVYAENSYTEGQLQYTLPAFSSGRHELRISAWDNLNNYSEQQVSFTTSAVNELSLAQVVNYPNPFTTDTRFTFQFQSPTNNIGDVTIKIYTISGRLIQEIETTATPGFNQIYWDGRDRNGDILANGVYLYKIIVNDGERSIEKIEKLAIVR
jgi:hypothetical protein